MKLLKTSLCIVIFLCAISCSDDDSDTPEEMSEGEVENMVRAFIGDGCFSVLEELNFSLNGGSNAPNVEGTFIINPVMIRASGNNQINTDSEGEFEQGVPFIISDIQPDGSFDFTFIFFQENITNPLWIGNGNDFSVFFTISTVIETQPELPTLNTTFGISGTITANGIVNGELFLCENENEEFGGFVISDGDDLVELFDN